MRPEARIQAAIEVLDSWLSGQPAEQVLTRWARANRYAGSKDRAAIRDHVYQAIRCRDSYAALGGALTGRGLMLGQVRASGADPAEFFAGAGYGPAALTPAEIAPAVRDLSDWAALDCPEWAWPLLESYGQARGEILRKLQQRAPVFLRVNSLKGTSAEAVAALAKEAIVAQPHPLAKNALEVSENARLLRNSEAYRNGLVELQDVASQAVVEALDLTPGQSVLDYCAGGGGKTLAIAAATGCPVVAHDANAARMTDLPARAARAGATVQVAPTEPGGPFDVVLCDVPCSGSGSWRRDPEGKCRGNLADLQALTDLQGQILRMASALVTAEGLLSYATCSLFDMENMQVVEGFLAECPEWGLERFRQFTPLDGGDGFFVALLKRDGGR